VRVVGTPEQALEAVRKVFAGDVKRNQVVHLPVRAQVYVGVAIILAFANHYLDDMVMVCPLNRTFEELLTLRNPERQKASTLIYDYTGACRDAGFYTPSPGRGGRKLVRLTPPAALTELVAELGTTPAAREFYAAAQAAVAAHQEARRQHKAARQAEAATPSEEADAILARIAAGGNELKWAIYRALRKELWNS